MDEEDDGARREEEDQPVTIWFKLAIEAKKLSGNFIISQLLINIS